MALAVPTKQQIADVKDSWAALKASPGLEPVGEAFFSELFAAHPEALELFTKFKDEQDWQHSVAFKYHARSVMQALDSAVADLDNLDSLVSTLRKLGVAHVNVGAQPEHYDWVGSALIETLQQTLAHRMTLDVKGAYEAVYGMVRFVMLEAAAAADARLSSRSFNVQSTADSSSEDEIPGVDGAPLQDGVNLARSTSVSNDVEQPRQRIQASQRPILRYRKSSSTSCLGVGLRPTALRVEEPSETSSAVEPHGSITTTPPVSRNGELSSLIWVGGIPDSGASDGLEQQIRNTFGAFGTVRRVFLRFKPENNSWCLLHFRAASAAAQAVSSKGVTMPDSNGKDVVLRVEWPRVVAERINISGAGNGDGDATVRPQAQSINTTPAKMKKPTGQKGDRRRKPSLTEETVRNALSLSADVGTSTPERVESLRPDHRSARSMWGKIVSQDPATQSPGDRSNRSRSPLRPRSVSALAKHDESTEKAARKAIKKKLHEVSLEDKEITKVIRAIVEMQGGEMQGLDFRFKSETSFFRKVMSRIDKARNTGSPGAKSSPTPEAIVASIVDVLRYCAVFPTKTYTRSVQACLKLLPQSGMKELRVKNFWGPGDGYQGINSVFVWNGLPFELQFHTPESFVTKEMECHPSYERFRTEDDSRKAMQYWEEMVSIWDSVPVPPDVLEIPLIVQQKLQFDLSMLTTQERRNIRYRKQLEHQCRYPVSELHTRARKANGEVLYLMQYLVHKHGAEDDCELMDTKKTLLPQISILRRLVDHFLVLMDDADGDDQPGGSPETSIGLGRTLKWTGSQSDGEESGMSRRRSVDLSMNGESFAKLKIGVTTTLREAGKSSTSVDLQQGSSSDDDDDATYSSSVAVSAESDGAQGGSLSRGRTLSNMPVPEIERIRDVLRELQSEDPALSYKIVCGQKSNYTSCVLGFLRDIASLAEYTVVAVNNWWDDVEKFGAINVSVKSTRHAVRFGVSIHTNESWSAYTTHLKYLRYKFDTVIKTDVLFADDPARVEQARTELRREEMFRDSWIKIGVPDDILTVGTLRYAHKPKPSATRLQDDALHTVGQSDKSLRRRLQQPVHRLMHINRFISRDEQNESERSSSSQSEPTSASDRLDKEPQQEEPSLQRPQNRSSSSCCSSSESRADSDTSKDVAAQENGCQLAADSCFLGYANLELSLVSSFFRAAPEIRAQFEEHRQRVLAEQGSLLWSRASGNATVEQHDRRLLQLETEIARLQEQTRTAASTAVQAKAPAGGWDSSHSLVGSSALPIAITATILVALALDTWSRARASR